MILKNGLVHKSGVGSCRMGGLYGDFDDAY